MDTSFIIVCLILVGSVFIPFFLLNAAGRAERKKIEEKINQAIAKNYLNIAKSENWGNTFIGLDLDMRKIVFFKISAIEIREQLIDLDGITGFHILEKRKTIKMNQKKELLLQNLDLEILQKNGNNLILNFYDVGEDSTEDFELQRIEKWKAILTSHISAIPFGKKAA